MSADIIRFPTIAYAQDWGPQALSGGSHRFQIWAPVLSSVGLRLNGFDMQMESRRMDGIVSRRALNTGINTRLSLKPDG